MTILNQIINYVICHCHWWYVNANQLSSFFTIENTCKRQDIHVMGGYKHGRTWANTSLHKSRSYTGHSRHTVEVKRKITAVRTDHR